MTKKNLEETIYNRIDGLHRQMNSLHLKYDANARAQLEVALSNYYVALSNLVNKKL